MSLSSRVLRRPKLFAAGVVMVVAGASLALAAYRHTLNWGDVPTWLGAITTALAFLAAAAVVTIELDRDADRRVERRRQALAAEQAEQADLVAAWFDPEEGAVLNNASNLPVYDLVMTFVPKTGDRFVMSTLGVVPPGRKIHGWTSEFQRFLDNQMGHHSTLEQVTDGLRIAIVFKDSAGRVWERNEGGLLRKTGVLIELGSITTESAPRRATPRTDTGQEK